MEGRPQGVVHSLHHDVGARDHQMRRKTEGRTAFDPLFDHDSRFIDSQKFAQSREFFPELRGELERRLVQIGFEAESHEASELATIGVDSTNINKRTHHSIL